LSTGEVESFGTHAPGTFSDSPSTRSSANVKDLDLGSRYAYSVAVAVNPAESLISTLETAEIDDTTLQKFERSVSKFRGPLQLRRSTLKSTQAQTVEDTPSRLSAADPISAGLTAVSTRSEISVPVSQSTSSTVALERRSDNMTLEWTYTGELSEVDHFQVYVTADGGREFIGTVHNDASSSAFSYRHFTEGFSQDYSYEVVPINLGFEELTPMASTDIAPQLLDSFSPRELSSAIVTQI
jgi:hypothetical protein